MISLTNPSLFIDEPEIEHMVLDFPNYVYALSNLILNSRPNYTVGIFGNWGTGKSTLMRNLQRQLSNDKCEWIEFNAWRYSHEERHATFPLMLTILSHLISNNKIKLSIEGGNLKKWKNSLTRILNGLNGSISSGLPGVIEGTLNIDPSAMEHTTEIQSKIDELFRQSKPLFQEGMEMIDDFIHEYKSNSLNSDLKLVVFIDDLDRCTPEKATEILESVKVFFDITGIVFIFGLSDEIIEAAINYKYKHFGEDKNNQKNLFSGKDYLKKIIQVPFSLPSWTTDDMTEYAKAIINNQKNDELKKFFESKISVIVEGIEKNPREVKRVLNSFIVSKLIQKNTDISMDNLLILLIIAHRWRDFYSHLISNSNFLSIVLKEWNSFQNDLQEAMGEPDDIETRYERMLKENKILSNIDHLESIIQFLDNHGSGLTSLSSEEWQKYRRAVIIEPEILTNKKNEKKSIPLQEAFEITEIDPTEKLTIRTKAPFWKRGGTQNTGKSPLFLSQTEQFQIINSEPLIFQYLVPDNLIVQHSPGVSHSSEIRLHISIDMELVTITPWLGFPGSSNNTLQTPMYKIENLRNGFHSLNLQPETKSAYLDNWGGTLIIYDSQKV